MDNKVWKGKWIEFNPQPYNPSLRAGILDGAPVFYNVFTLENKPQTARIEICGLGFCVLKINGKRVGDELSPAFSAYDKTVYYNTYSIVDFLQVGKNFIEITLGNGWFLEFKKSSWEFEHATWRARQQLICEIFADDELILKSDSSWQCGRSKTIFNSLRYGETYDSTAEISDHISASIAHGPGGILKPQAINPIKVCDVLEPICIVPGTENVYDFGVNLSGNVEITVLGERGSQVSIQYCESIDKNGEPDLKDILHDQKLERFQKDIYILAGDGEESWHSSFGYNGFRYAKIVTDAKLISVKARNLHTDLPYNGGFEIDNPFLTDLQSALVRSTLANFHHLPTDCPHREKNGWTGDAHLSSEQALFNFDIYDAYIKYLDDIVDCQRVNGAIPCIAPTSIWGYNWGTGNAWDVALFEIPWKMYCFKGDISVLKRYYSAMEKYYNYMLTMEDNGIWKNGLGDWCAPDQTKTVSPYAVLTAYAYKISVLFSKISKLLGKEKAYQSSIETAEKIKETFISVFADKEDDTQSLLSMQLYFGLTENQDETVERLLKQIEKDNYHLTTGIFGTKFLFNVLTDNDHFDVAYRILTAPDFPGYKYMLENSSGTLCENWTAKSASKNHHMYSTIGDWFYKGIAGIKIDEDYPGFKKIIIKPNVPNDCQKFKVWHQTPLGKLAIEYNDKQFMVDIPEGCEATFVYNGKQFEISGCQYISI